jgi:hypothetical protein
MIQLTLYTKPGCHLCEEMKRVIAAVAARVPLELTEMDITRDAALEQQYGLAIPVLERDGKVIAKYRVSETALEQRLKQ